MGSGLGPPTCGQSHPLPRLWRYPETVSRTVAVRAHTWLQEPTQPSSSLSNENGSLALKASAGSHRVLRASLGQSYEGALVGIPASCFKPKRQWLSLPGNG